MKKIRFNRCYYGLNVYNQGCKEVKDMTEPIKFTLKSARQVNNLTQKRAAELIGINKDTLSAYERGIRYPDVPVLKKIEQVYGIGYNDIIFLPKANG